MFLRDQKRSQKGGSKAINNFFDNRKITIDNRKITLDNRKITEEGL